MCCLFPFLLRVAIFKKSIAIPIVLTKNAILKSISELNIKTQKRVTDINRYITLLITLFFLENCISVEIKSINSNRNIRKNRIESQNIIIVAENFCNNNGTSIRLNNTINQVPYSLENAFLSVNNLNRFNFLCGIKNTIIEKN